MGGNNFDRFSVIQSDKASPAEYFLIIASAFLANLLFLSIS